MHCQLFHFFPGVFLDLPILRLYFLHTFRVFSLGFWVGFVSQVTCVGTWGTHLPWSYTKPVSSPKLPKSPDEARTAGTPRNGHARDWNPQRCGLTSHGFEDRNPGKPKMWIEQPWPWFFEQLVLASKGSRGFMLLEVWLPPWDMTYKTLTGKTSF